MKMLLLWLVILLGTVMILDRYSCNPKNSLAAQIDWAGRPECK